MMKQLTHHQLNYRQTTFPITVFACHLRTPENIGMLMRVSEAFGVEKIYVHHNSPPVSSRAVKRISRHTAEHLPVIIYSDPIAELEELKQQNYTIIALEITDVSIPLSEMRLHHDGKFVIVAGEERNGIPEDVLNLCDYSVHLPMYGKNSSLNVVNSLTVALYEMTNRLLKG